MSNLNQHVVHLTTNQLKDIIDERLKLFLNQSNQLNSSNRTDKELLPELLTRQQVAEIFEVSFVTLHNWVKHGVLPKPIKKGKMVYFLRKDIIHSINTRSNG